MGFSSPFLPLDDFLESLMCLLQFMLQNFELLHQGMCPTGFRFLAIGSGGFILLCLDLLFSRLTT
jgi:hypothetical protein